ncbi:MAG: MFS transporter [Chloroflexi bacterium]|nr:MFS transporter [Chloroflexota bacterium]
MKPPEITESVRNRSFALFAGGQAISMLGTFAQTTAQSYVVYQMTKSTTLLGLVNALAFVPLLLIGPLAGAWSDRLDRRRVLLISQSVAALLAGVMALLLQYKALQVWHILLLTFILGVINALDLPAQSAIVGDIVGTADVRRGASIIAMVQQIGRMGGPALAGFLLAHISQAGAFWLNAASFAPVIISLLLIRTQQVRQPANGRSLAQDFGEGLRYVWSQPRMVDLFLLAILTVLFGFIGPTLWPEFVATTLKAGPDTLGLLTSATGVGAMIAAAVLVPWSMKHVQHPGRMLVILLLGIGLMQIANGLAHQLWLSFAVVVVSAICVAGTLITAGGLLQQMSPPAMRGRIMTLFQMASWGMQLPGALIAGLNGSFFGAANAIVLSGLLLLIGVAAMIALRPAIRHWQPALVNLTAGEVVA